MRQYNKKLLAVGTLLVVLAVSGCAASTSYEGPPPPPECETEEGLVAADACQAIYSCCTRDCDNTKLRSGKPGAIQECMAACATNLEDCYRVIE
jgi:hypothetical protein